MSYRSLFLFAFSLSVILGLSAAAFGQVAPVSGTVVMENADGTKTPVAGALIEVYRTDMKVGFPSAKTAKRGDFVFAGMPIVGTFLFAVSAPGASPVVFPNVRGGQEKLVIVLAPGDGRKFTEAEARGNAVAAASTGGLSEEQKKEREELLKKNAAIQANNEKIKNADDVARRSVDEGRAALKAEDWDTAIAKFNEGIAAVPDFVGSTPILLNGKMAALKAKGYKAYREGIGQQDFEVRKAKYEEANKYYDEALAGFDQAMVVVKKADAPATPDDTKIRNIIQSELYALATEIHRLKAVGGVDASKAAKAKELVNEYVAFETDPAKKISALVALGDIMRLTGDFPAGVAAYKQVLALKPDAADVMGKLGLTLFAQGAAATPEDKAMEQEGLNYMQKYTEMAPVAATDSQSDKELKISVKEAVDYLKAQKMAPQKIATPGRKKNN